MTCHGVQEAAVKLDAVVDQGKPETGALVRTIWEDPAVKAAFKDGADMLLEVNDGAG